MAWRKQKTYLARTFLKLKLIVFSKFKGIRFPFTSTLNLAIVVAKILRFDAKNDTFFADSVVQPTFRLLNFSFCQKNALHYISDPQIVSDKPLQISPIYLSGEMKKVTTYSVILNFSVFSTFTAKE